MTLPIFKALNFKRKRMWILEYGVFLAERKLEGNSVYLFQLNNFYSEIHYLENDTLFKLRSFTNTEELDSYLQEINISAFFN